MDLHVYRNSQDRWHDLKAAARKSGAVLATNAFTLDELVQRLTPDLKAASPAQRLVCVGASRHAYDAVRALKAAQARSVELRRVDAGALADILDRYNARLSTAGLVDPEDRRWIAAGRVAEGDPWVRQFDRVVVHAIYDLTECEFALIENLIKAAPEGGVVILFNTTTNIKPTQFAEWTWQRFIRDETLAEKTFPEFCRSAGPARELLERLFVWEGVGDRISNSESFLRIRHARGRYSEIEIIGSEIAALLAAGADPNEIAVVVRHIDAYGELVEDVFSRYSIPHAFETGIPIIRVPFIKYWIALLDMAANNRSRDAMARILASAYFEPRLSPKVDVAQILIEIGYIDRDHLKASLLASRRSSILTAELERFETFLDRLESAVLTPSEFLDQLQPGARLTDRDRQAWRTLSEELAAISKLLGPMPFADFKKIASEIAGLRTIDRFSGRPIAPGISRVRVMSPAALGSRAYRWVFSPGFADGEIPARSSPNPLLTDALIESLNQQTRSKRLLTSRDRNRAEPLYLFMLFDTATERVTITLPSSTLEGEPIYPSIYVAEILRHLKDAGEPHDGEVEIMAKPLVSTPVHRAADYWRQQRISDEHARALLGDDVVRRAFWERRGFARADLGTDVFPMDAVFTPSQLNSLEMCPFVFLARHRLRLRSQDLPDFDIPAFEIGNLAHRILKAFYSEPVPDSDQAATIRMDEIIRRQLAPLDINGQGPTLVVDPALWKIRRPQLVNALMEYVKFAVRDARDGYQTMAEYLDQALPPAYLGGAQLAGRPDHVAVRRDAVLTGIRVDDFKYSPASSGMSRQLKQSFQIPVYAYLTAKAIEAENGVPIEGRYLLLRSPSNPVVACSIDESLFTEIERRIEALMEIVRSGKLSPDPADRQECSSCDYRRLCRFYG